MSSEENSSQTQVGPMVCSSPVCSSNAQSSTILDAAVDYIHCSMLGLSVVSYSSVFNRVANCMQARKMLS